MRARLATPRAWRRPFGLFGYHRDDQHVLSAGLHLNRIGDRPEGWQPSKPAGTWTRRPAVKGRHVIGCWLKVRRHYVSWVWPIEIVVDR